MALVTTVAGDEEAAIGVAGALDGDFDVSVVNEARKFFAPLDEENGVIGDQVVEPKGFELAGRVHAVEINVIDVHVGAAVFVDQSEGGAVHVLLRGGVKAFGDAFDESSFAGAKIAAQENQTGWSEDFREFAAESDGFVGRVGGELFRHRSNSV